MANTKISDLTNLGSTPAAGDLLVIVDVDDLNMGSSGTDKQISFTNLTGTFATNGANSNITSLTGLTTPLTVAQGGTGAATLTGILLGAGTSAITALSSSGTGNVVRVAGATLTTPTLGVATATSYNGLTLTSTTGTFTLTNAKVLTVSDSTTLATNAITLGGGEVITFSASNALSLLTSGTTSMTFPAATDTVAVLGTAQTYTATQTEKQVIWTNNAITASGNAATVPITHRLHTVTNNSAATLTITMTTTSAVDGALEMIRILDSSGVAQTITWVNTENSTVSAPTTSNGSTTLPLTVGFQYNSLTSKWRCIASS